MQTTIVSGIVTFSVTVNTNDTIESVMHQIHEELGIPPEQQPFIVENEGEGKGKGKICEGVGWDSNKGKSKKGPY